MQAEFGLDFPLIEASAEDVPLPDESFDLAISEYGASIWADPYRWIPEAARLLRPGGHLVFLVNGTIMILCSADEELPPDRKLLRPYFGMHRFEWDGTGGIEFHLGYGDWIRASAGERLRCREPDRDPGAARGRGAPVPGLAGPRLVAEVALRGDLGRPQALVSVPPAPPLLLASTSPQRRAILEQLRIPFELAVPDYEEHDPPDADVVALVREHAAGKARSVGEPDERPVLGVDTAVHLDGRVFGKPSGPGAAEQMLEALGGHTHEVVSGLCLRTPGWEVVEHEVTRVTFRPLTPRDLAAYVAAESGRDGRAPTPSRVSALRSSSASKGTT